MSSTTGAHYITTVEAAARAGVALCTIHRWKRSGLFTYKHKNRKNIVVNEAEFTRFLADLTAPVTQSTG